MAPYTSIHKKSTPKAKNLGAALMTLHLLSNEDTRNLSYCGLPGWEWKRGRTTKLIDVSVLTPSVVFGLWAL